MEDFPQALFLFVVFFARGGAETQVSQMILFFLGWEMK